MKTPRDYQEECLQAIWKCLHEREGHYIAAVAGGGGKSLIMAELIKRLHNKYPRLRIVSLVHTQDLLIQNSAELLEQYPNVDMGFYCAGLNEKRLHNDVTFASIQSICGKILDFNRVPEIIIVDECDMIPHDMDTQYRKFLDSVLELNPNCKIVGLTGTYWRENDGLLYKGEGALFSGLSYEIGTKFLIEEGYLVKPTSPSNKYKMDTAGVSMRGGDFVESQLQDVVDTDEVTSNCVDEIIALHNGRTRWLGMTCGVSHCENVTNEFIKRGFNARMIIGDTDKDERKETIEWFKEETNDIRILVNVGTMNVGLNVPALDLLFIMRPTRSKRLYTQFVWREMRPLYASGYDLSTKIGRLEAIANSKKPDALLIDFGGVVDALGPIDIIDIKAKIAYTNDKNDEVGEAIMKICPSCGVECAASQQYCYECSYCFLKLEAEASSQAIVSMDQEPEWVEVMAMVQNMNRHADNYETPSMTVTYATRLGAIREWVCFEHWKFEQGNNKRYAYEMAMKWHRARLPDEEIPQTTMDAVNTKYPQPKRILVKKKGKYWNVINYEWGEKEEEQEEFFEIPF